MLKQSLQQKLQQKLSPQQIQLMKLLQVPTLELEARIKEELEANPALEEGRDEEANVDSADGLDDDRGETREDFDFDAYLDDPTPGYKYAVNNHAEHEDRETAFGAGETFSDRLIAQVGLRPVSDRQRMLATFLIGNLDEAGYLRRDLYAISSDLAFGQGVEVSEEELEAVLEMVHQLDPAGVGARDLRECLLLQIDRKLEGQDADGTPALRLARRILEEQFDAFTKKHYDKLVARFEVGEDALRAAVAEITRLNPKPGNSGSDNARPIQAVVPDFHVSVEGDELRLQINGRNAPELKVSQDYQEMMQGYAAAKDPDRAQKEAITFVKRKVDAAKWFIDAIKQRQNTLRVTMQAILQIQEAYFLTGDETDLKPMILKDVAERINMDISTVSRVANSKYVQTPYGTFLLKSLFSESLTTESGEEVSTREVKKILEEAVEAEDKRKPLSDEKLMNVLQEKGYRIARRTVAKYREQLGIPVARLRKEL
ncbi:MAG: RNA polymerase factor sigma-54 [Flavobacteriales bacterium]|nr:RNA polymerase factor sigma-54 [Flavobacteriales bacterium]